MSRSFESGQPAMSPVWPYRCGVRPGRILRRAGPGFSLFPAAPGWLLVRGAGSGHHPRIRLHHGAYVAGYRRRAQDEAGGAEILRKQNEDGGWSIYAGGPSNISASVKAYFAFKLMGWLPEHPVMVHARQWILDHGGVVECNTFTKIYLCFFGQYEYDAVPAIPPELVLFPNWCYFNIYEISSWSRAILVPLSIAYAKKPFKKLAPENGIDELFVGGKSECQASPPLGSQEGTRLAQLLPDGGPALSLGRAGAYPAAAQGRYQKSGEVDPGTPGDE